MEKFFLDKSKKLEQIYKGLSDSGFIREDLDINFNILIRDMYDINGFLNKTYIIFSDKKATNLEKAKRIHLFEDSYGNKLLTLSQSKKVVKLYKNSFLQFFEKLLNRKKSNLEKRKKLHHKGGKKKNPIYDYILDPTTKETVNINTRQGKKVLLNYIRFIKGGAFGDSEGSKLTHKSQIDNEVKNTSKEIAKKLKNMPFPKSQNVGDLKESLLESQKKILLEMPIVSSNKYSDLYDWIFHPLWKLENHNKIGFLFPIPLDIMGSIIDGINLINPFIMVIMEKVIAWAGTAAGAGVGAAIGTAIGACFVGVGALVGGPGGPVATAWIWPTLGQPVVAWLLDNYIDIISMFYNIARRNLGMAYINALSAIPYFDVIVDFTVKQLLRVNTHVDRFKLITEKVRGVTQISSDVVVNILENPNALLDIRLFYKKIVKSSLRKLPHFKNLPEEALDQYELYFDKFYENGKKSVDCLLNKQPLLLGNTSSGKSNFNEFMNCFSNF